MCLWCSPRFTCPEFASEWAILSALAHYVDTDPAGSQGRLLQGLQGAEPRAFCVPRGAFQTCLVNLDSGPKAIAPSTKLFSDS